MPSFALRMPVVRPALSIRKRFATARPAASSAELLMRRPEVKRARVFCNPILVLSNWAWEFKDEMLVTTEKLIEISSVILVCPAILAGAFCYFRPGSIGPPWTAQSVYRTPLSRTLRKRAVPSQNQHCGVLILGGNCYPRLLAPC